MVIPFGGGDKDKIYGPLPLQKTLMHINAECCLRLLDSQNNSIVVIAIIII